MIEKPSPWVVRYSSSILAKGRVLDLACGRGRHAIWLARQGYQVDAIDRDREAIASMHGMQNIHTHLIDLEAKKWPEAHQYYDGIVVSRYLYRPLLPVLAGMLNNGGILIYETFMVGNERYGKPSSPDFLLLQDELLNVYSALLSVVAFEQGKQDAPTPAVMQRICAVKNATPLIDSEKGNP